MTPFTLSPRARIPTLALAALLPIAPLAHAVGGQWDTPLAVTGSAGTGNGASSATPWIATPATGSTYAEWNFFNGYPTDSTPDIAGSGASVTENTGMAFATGGGNIYSFAAATDFTLTAAAVSGAADVWLRIATIGTAALPTATLNGVGAQAVQTYSAASGSSFGGDEKEWVWTWNNVSATAYSFGFGASGSSMSLDQLAVYGAAAPVPEPESALMLAAGLSALGWTAHRRRRTQG